MEIRNHIYHFSVEPKLTGKRIKELRKARNMTAQNLADTLLCSVKTVFSWETGARFPSIDNLVDLSNFFDVSVHSLMLPMDNCPSGYMGFHPNDVEMRGNPSHFAISDSDSALASMLIREEYLIQRYIFKVFTSENTSEFKEILDAFVVQFNVEDFIRTEKEDSAEAYFRFKKCCPIFKQKMYVLFNRIWNGEDLKQALISLDLFEKSVFFTVMCYFPDLRALDCGKLLYEQGARFIDCKFAANADAISKGIERKNRLEQILNIRAYTISTEEECQKHFHCPTGISEDSINDYFAFLERPRFVDNPSHYLGRVFRNIMMDEREDLAAREKLVRYYYHFDYIIDTVSSLTELDHLTLKGTVDYNAYLSGLIQGERVAYAE